MRQPQFLSPKRSPLVLGLANGANLWIYWLSEFLGAGIAACLFLVVNQEKPHGPAVASHDRAQEQTNQSIGPGEHLPGSASCLAAGLLLDQDRKYRTNPR